jgi:hypothetical protein
MSTDEKDVNMSLEVQSMSKHEKDVNMSLELEYDPDGWVAMVSDGPGARVPALAAGDERQQQAGDTGGGGGGAIVNFKRFCKKSDGSGQDLAKGHRGGGQQQATVTFEVWPKRVSAGNE